MDALEGTLPDGRILSHDLIEGEYARAAFVSDISLYDGFPETFSAYLKRLNRWTRGDWQILPYLFKRGLSGLSRLKIFDNLIQSHPAALMGFSAGDVVQRAHAPALGMLRF